MKFSLRLGVIIRIIVIGLIISNCSLFAQGEYLVELDRTNGNHTILTSTLPGITFVFPDDRAFNESTGTYIFPSSLVDHRLYSVNTITGSVLNNPLIGDIAKFEFDNNTGILYGIERDNGNDEKSLISINAATGAYTPIGSPISGANAAFSAFDISTYDETNKIYYLLDPTSSASSSVLFGINATNGNVISSPVVTPPTGENIINITFDNASGNLYGLLYDTNVNKYFLIEINPTSATYTKIGNGTTFFGNGSGSATIDEANQQYIFLYTDSVGYNIATLDLPTGNEVYNEVIIPYTNQDNFFSIKYDRVQERLFSIHYRSTKLALDEIQSSEMVTVFPNPTTKNVFVNIEDDTYFSLHDISGKKLNARMISKANNEISLSKYTAGMYFLHLESENRHTFMKILKK